MNEPDRVPASHLVRAPGRRLTLGLLVDHIEDSYQNELLLRVSEAARARGASLLVYAGEALELPGGERPAASSVYDLACRAHADALIVSAGTLENRIGSLALLDYLKRFSLPLCSVGIALPDIPSVLVDNVAAMCDLVTHLIASHDRQRIAFLRGPQGNDESTQRYRGYLKALLDHRLRPAPELVCDGDFMLESGASAVRALLDERRTSFDALVAANDHMALGAMEELERRGLQVPEDVAVVGFDDTYEGRFARVPLTTVRQPIRAQAEQAVHLALTHHYSSRDSEKVMITTEPVLRRSCGCLPQRQRLKASSSGANEEAQTALIDRRDSMIRALAALAPELGANTWAERLVDEFLGEFRGKQGVSFLASFESAVERIESVRSEHVPQQLLSALHGEAVLALAAVPSLLLKAEGLLHEARIVAARAAEAAEVRRRVQLERASRTLRDLNLDLEDLRTPADRETFCRALLSLGVPGCVVAITATPAAALSGEVLETLVVLRDGERLEATAERFLAEELAPKPARTSVAPVTTIVRAIEAYDSLLGLVTFELGPPDGMIYTSLASLLGSVLRRRMRPSVPAVAALGARQLERLRDDLFALGAAEQQLRERLSGAMDQDGQLHETLARVELHLRSCLRILEEAQSEAPDSAPLTQRGFGV